MIESNEFKTEIEGKIDDRKMDVVVESGKIIEEKNNDDKILSYCTRIENPIFLTNDVALCLKCESSNIKYIKVEGKNIKMIISEVHKIIGLEGDDRLGKAEGDFIEVLKEEIKKTIEPKIIDILKLSLGENYKIILNDNPDLLFYLKIVRDNFFIFKSFLPKGSVNIIIEYIGLFKLKDIAKIKQLSGTICVMFHTKMPKSLK